MGKYTIVCPSIVYFSIRGALPSAIRFRSTRSPNPMTVTSQVESRLVTGPTEGVSLQMALMALMALMAHYHWKQRDGHRRGVEVRIKVVGDGKDAGPGRDRHRFAVSEADCDDLGKLVGGRSDRVNPERLLRGQRA